MKKSIAPKKKIAPKAAPIKAALRQRVSAAMDIEGVISRIMELEGVKTVKDVATALDMKPQALSTARSAGKIALDVLYLYAARKKVSFDWLLTGEQKGVPRELAGIMEDSAAYEVLKALRAIPRSRWGLVRDIIKMMSEEFK